MSQRYEDQFCMTKRGMKPKIAFSQKMKQKKVFGRRKKKKKKMGTVLDSIRSDRISR